MDCPVCQNAMIVLELEQIEVDFCIDCGGIWLDAGELELLLEDADEAKNLLASFRKAPDTCGEILRRCPICLKKMQKILVSDSLLIDKCRKNHGLWFDKGELEDVLTMGSLDSKHSIHRLLGRMFTNYETPSKTGGQNEEH
ncbi:MAG: zf-TFIIB domain-containing protein [Planctomycetota bacterium]